MQKATLLLGAALVSMELSVGAFAKDRKLHFPLLSIVIAGKMLGRPGNLITSTARYSPRRPAASTVFAKSELSRT